MIKFDFLATDLDGGVLQKKFEGNTLGQILENFEDFLRGAGFYFSGHVDIVANENYFKTETKANEHEIL